MKCKKQLDIYQVWERLVPAVIEEALTTITTEEEDAAQ